MLSKEGSFFVKYGVTSAHAAVHSCKQLCRQSTILLSTYKYNGHLTLVDRHLTFAMYVQVCQPWDAKKFNFQKALQQEILFQYEAGLPDHGNQLKFIPASPANNSPNLVFINVSPIEYGHVLLVPRVMDDLTQLVDQKSMRLALQFCEHSSNPYFRLCYNSLGAYGTINHLHFQVRSFCINCTTFITCLPSQLQYAWLSEHSRQSTPVFCILHRAFTRSSRLSCGHALVQSMCIECARLI